NNKAIAFLNHADELAQSIQKEKGADSALEVDKVSTYIALSIAHMNLKSYDTAKIYAQKILNNIYTTAAQACEANLWLGNIYLFGAQMDAGKALYHLQKAQECYTKPNTQEAVAVNIYIGVSESRLKLFKQAEYHLQTALKGAQALSQRFYRQLCYLNLSALY